MHDEAHELSSAEQKRLLLQIGADSALRACWQRYLESKFAQHPITERHARYFLEAAREALRYGFTGEAVVMHALTVTVNALAAFGMLHAGGRRINRELFRRSVRGQHVPRRKGGTRYDREGREISRERWVELYDDADYRLVERTAVGTHRDAYDGRLELCVVQTLWVGVDQNSEIDGPALIFETEACTHVEDRIVHYATEQDARAGHAEMLRRLPPHGRLGNN